MAKLLIATTNRGKLREILALLEKEQVEIVTADELGIVLDYEETSNDIQLVAREKALHAWRKSSLPSLAEDTALEVDALGGLPWCEGESVFRRKCYRQRKMAGTAETFGRSPERKTNGSFPMCNGSSVFGK